MRKLLRLVLIYAALFAVMALVPILVLYLELESDRLLGMIPDVPHENQIEWIDTLRDADALRRACHHLANQVDRYSELFRWSWQSSRKLAWGFIGTLLLLNGLAIAAFLNVAWELRKLLRTGEQSAAKRSN